MKTIRFAVLTDLHYDFIHDGERRVKEFVNDIKEKDVDFIISLGDLCYPIKENNKIIDMLSSLKVPCYYTIGNHDSDAFSKDAVIKYLGLKNNYYSFSKSNVKFIVLDSCYIKKESGYESYYKRNYDKSKDIYPYIPEFELKWLKDELSDDNKYYIIFSHHSLVNDFAKRGIANREEVRKVIEEAEKNQKKVLLCMNGHDHGDSVKEVDGVTYYTLNSMSYIWHGTHKNCSYSKEVLDKYPYIKDFILYEDAFHAIVTVYDNGKVKIDGMKGEYQTITPAMVGVGDSWNGVSTKPLVSSLEIGEKK